MWHSFFFFFFKSFHPLKDFFIAFSFGRLWVKLLYMFVCKIYENMFLNQLGKYPEV